MRQAPMDGEGRARSGQRKLPSEVKALGVEVSGKGEAQVAHWSRSKKASEVSREGSVTGCVHRPCEVVEGLAASQGAELTMEIRGTGERKR